jgi:hypothetical protein
MKTLHVAIGMYLCASCGGAMRQGHPPVDANAGFAPDGQSSDDTDASDTVGATGATDGQVCYMLAGGVVHIPAEHRAVSQSCPSERGSIGPIDASHCTDTSGLACTSDADCVAGRNGRCQLNGSQCRTYCSYDDCGTDTDCPDRQPCICRSGGTDTMANRCLAGSNCRTDDDCGECGFCSHSVQRADLQCPSGKGCSGPECDGGGTASQCICTSIVGSVYACHSRDDECGGDSDCPGLSAGYCAYVEAAGHWMCGSCTIPNFM